MSDLLSVPLKKPTDVDVTRPLNNLIKSSYSSLGPEKMAEISESVNKFNQQRTTSVWKAFEKYESSLEILYGFVWA